MKQVYRQVWGSRGPYAATRHLIHRSDQILTHYWSERGYALTLRQLFYRLVVENAIENRQETYTKTSTVVTNARYAGLIDWRHVIDRTRGLADWTYHADEPAAIGELAEDFRLNKWDSQPARIELWIEKDAAIGTIEAVAQELEVPYGSTRGYHSTSGSWQGARRVLRHIATGQRILALHIADHDPSGVDMTRDLQNRLTTFLTVDCALLYRKVRPEIAMDEAMSLASEYVREHLEIRRIALNRDQVTNLELEHLSQTVKAKDPRTPAYRTRFGDRCWELDAIEPEEIERLIRHHVLGVRDASAWKAGEIAERAARANLALVRDSWPAVIDRLTEVEPSW